ncbi:MAG: 2,3-bisphosphoglycerate-independent phosphoglycerate mutase [Acidobacteria bacterium]|nr:2,3-bisphosphoglycerate-independent phosphoglycerate mutase [Acidobacteriota bacterium]
MTRGPVVLTILDGWGIREERAGNAIALASTPTYDEMLRRYAHTTLDASGEAVGLPAGQMGNSEVGHMNMGAGRVVYQDLTRIDKLIGDGEFFTNDVLGGLVDRSAREDRALHLIGLVSDGGVHSHQRHLHALIRMAARRHVQRLFVHAITDGRDTSPTSGVRCLHELETCMASEGTGQIATVTGRYYAMDRDKRWERTRLAYDAMTFGDATPTHSATEYLQRNYNSGITDEFLKPAVVVNAHEGPVGTIRAGDSVVFFNFRADRARQLTRALTDPSFVEFERRAAPHVMFGSFTMYDATYDLPVAFVPQAFSGSLAEVLAAGGVPNLRLAETEKYAHVTYFFNCGEERPYPGEDRILIPSAKVPTYDLQPEMSAEGITDALVAAVLERRHKVVVCNFANADMVGHTGKLDATIVAVQVLDRCLARIATAVRRAGGTLIVTSDHGNCERMWDPALDAPHTAHTSNPVPFLISDEGSTVPLRSGGALCDVAPTILGLLGIQPSADMTGRDLRNL